MTILKIFNDERIITFDRPPELSIEEKSIHFEITEEVSKHLNNFRNNNNKMLYMLELGYFKAAKKFYSPRHFKKDDIKYIERLLGLNSDTSKRISYPKSTINRVKTLILNQFGWMEFDNDANKRVFEVAINLVSNQKSPRTILIWLVEYLEGKKIEIPKYNTLAIIITKALHKSQKNLLKTIDKKLSYEAKKLLDELLKGDEYYNISFENMRIRRYKLALLKKFKHSLKPKEIKQNISDFIVLKDLYQKLINVIQALKLPDEVIEYYATYVIKSKKFQLEQFSDDNKRYLYLIGFIMHQQNYLHDMLIEILIKSVTKAFNKIKNLHKIRFFEDRESKNRRLVELLDKLENGVIISIDEIEEIILQENTTDSEKIELLRGRFNSYKIQKDELKKEIKELKKMSEEVLKNNDYYKLLENASKKLQNKVSRIVENIILDDNCEDKNLQIAINNYKSKKGLLDRFSPDTFLNRNEKGKIFDENGTFRISLYKMLLFEKVIPAIKAGTLTFKNSYKYKSLEDYLICKEDWDNNKNDLCKKAFMEDILDVNKLLDELDNDLHEAYIEINNDINNGNNKDITFDKHGNYHLKRKMRDDNEYPSSLGIIFPQDKYISLFELLTTIDKHTNFLSSFEHFNNDYNPTQPDKTSLYAGVMTLGCNFDCHKMEKISKGLANNNLDTILNNYFSKENCNNANKKVIDFIGKLDITKLFKNDLNKFPTCSDGQKYSIGVASLNANSSFKYFKQRAGNVIYSFIDDIFRMFYSTVISASERESMYVLDGLLDDSGVYSDMHTVDTHGVTEAIFGVSHLILKPFAPRIKGITSQKLYSIHSNIVYNNGNYRIIPDCEVDNNLIIEHWDEILRFIATIKLKVATPSQLFRRLNSYSKTNPLYKAIKEFGRIIKSIFILKYLNDASLRDDIQKQENKIELAQKLAKAIWIGNNGEFKYALKEEQEIADACKRLIENCVVCWNYLLVSDKYLHEDEDGRNRLKEMIKTSSILYWKHFNFHGNYDFTSLENMIIFDIEDIMRLNIF